MNVKKQHDDDDDEAKKYQHGGDEEFLAMAQFWKKNFDKNHPDPDDYDDDCVGISTIL